MKSNKTRDMVRSVLPSSWRGASKERRAAHHRARSRVRTALQTFDPYSDEDEDLTMQIHVADTRRRRDIRTVVMDRRGADKINHFVRWASARTKGIESAEGKKALITSTIGGSGDVIRSHALGHFLSEGDMNPHYGIWRWSAARPRQAAFHVLAFKKALVSAFETCHKRLNRVLKDAACFYTPCRKDHDTCVGESFYTCKDFSTGEVTRYSCATHDYANCKNKIVILSRADVERVADFAMRGHDGEYWRSCRAHDDQIKLQAALKALLVSKGFMRELRNSA